jgi:hypothetical protein
VIERGLGSAAELGETASEHDLAECLFGHLIAQRYVSGCDGIRGAEEDRASGVQTSHWVHTAFDRFCRHRLNQEHGALRCQRLGCVRDRPDGIPHVVQAIEERDQGVVRAREVLGTCHLEGDAITDARLLGRAPGSLDGWTMGIEAEEAGVGEGLGHQNGRGPIAAPHIRYLRSRLQALLYPIEGRNPALHEIGSVARPEEAINRGIQFRSEALNGYAVLSYRVGADHDALEASRRRLSVSDLPMIQRADTVQLMAATVFNLGNYSRCIEVVREALAVMDATATGQVVLVSLSMGAYWGLLLAAKHPERVAGAVFIGPALPLGPGHPHRMVYSFDDILDTDEGWASYNRHYWLRDYQGFLEFFMSQIFTEPHSTKQIEDAVGWGLETTPEVLIATKNAPFAVNEENVR